MPSRSLPITALPPGLGFTGYHDNLEFSLEIATRPAHPDLFVGLGRNILAHVVELDGQLAVSAIHQSHDLNRTRTAKVHQRVHRGANRSPGLPHIVHEDHHSIVHRGGHFGLTQQGPLARELEVVAVERGVEDPNDDVDVCDLLEIGGELACERNPTVRDRDQIEAFEVFAALEDFVCDAHQGAANRDVVHYDASRVLRAGIRMPVGLLGGHVRTFSASRDGIKRA